MLYNNITYILYNFFTSTIIYHSIWLVCSSSSTNKVRTVQLFKAYAKKSKSMFVNAFSPDEHPIDGNSANGCTQESSCWDWNPNPTSYPQIHTIKKSPFTRQKLSKSTSNYSSLWIRCKSIPVSIFFLMNRVRVYNRSDSTDSEWNRVNHWVAAKFLSEFELRWYWEETQESCPDGKACYLFPCHTMAGAMRCQKGHKTSLRMPCIVLRHASGMRLFAIFIRIFVAKIRNKLKQKDTNTPNNPKTSFWALL